MTDSKDAAFAAGMKVRREMFGPGGAEERLAQATDFNRPLEDVVTRYCFGETWTRPGLDRRTRSAITLTAHEFKLLKFFLDNAERVLSREELLNDVWGYHFIPSTRTVDNQILKLRQKLEVDPANPKHFRTLHGTGYKFVF